MVPHPHRRSGSARSILQPLLLYVNAPFRILLRTHGQGENKTLRFHPRHAPVPPRRSRRSPLRGELPPLSHSSRETTGRLRTQKQDVPRRRSAEGRRKTLLAPSPPRGEVRRSVGPGSQLSGGTASLPHIPRGCGQRRTAGESKKGIRIERQTGRPSRRQTRCESVERPWGKANSARSVRRGAWLQEQTIPSR